MAWDSTERISTNTRIRGKASKDWDTAVFNYGRNEVRSFLLSSALFWLEQYHMPTGYAWMLSPPCCIWITPAKKANGYPTRYGGRENLEAIDFLRQMNEEIYRRHPDVQTIAEESTSWPSVSRPTYAGGLGFGMKWDMGWMHDTLKYMSLDPVYRKYHHNQLTFRMIYAFQENFVLPLSHDEVVHGKGSLLGQMPGDHWQKFANLRLLFAYKYAQPAKKLLFMGAEIGQWSEWAHDDSLDWHLAGLPSHHQVQRWVSDLNHVYRKERALHELDCDGSGFEWIDCKDADQSMLSFFRRPAADSEAILVVSRVILIIKLLILDFIFCLIDEKLNYYTNYQFGYCNCFSYWCKFESRSLYSCRFYYSCFNIN